MKILHTSDWHIGKQLKKVDFSQDLDYFFDWLIKTIQEQKIDVLLMSGDLFDTSNPSQAALKQYYEFLKKMITHNADCKIVITGGNHDGPLALNAPKDLLQILNVSVVGGVSEMMEDMFVKINKDKESLVVAAIPFLRDKDIRTATTGQSYQEKTQQTREGIQSFFHNVIQHYRDNYQSLPFIVMGHLFVQGAAVSESERQIQVGNLAGVNGSIFGTDPHYVALGHIHKPQTAGAQHVRYSGSPIPLSFSEKNDTKQVVILEWKNDTFEIEPVAVPSFRKLITYSGTLEEVKAKIKNHRSDSHLKDLVEIIVEEEQENMSITQELIALASDPGNDNLIIISHKLTFRNRVDGLASLLGETADVHRYSPLDIFRKRIGLDESISTDSEFSQELEQAFSEILDELNQEPNE
ncbi:MAG: exonuclease subunit SbcD [Bacteroidetes bacterium]|nr:exonuclease subunit SbcD [Bacteroidota bacterium]